MPADPRLIVPLDLPTRGEAEAMVEALGDAVSFYKIGLQLLAGGGMDLARRLKAGGFSIFLDWKLHDIGATVEKAAAAIVESGACDFLTVHAEPQVLRAAVKGRAGHLQSKILGVTVARRIGQVIDAGADGVIASPYEAALARRLGGPDFLVITPGIRPAGASLDDQARAATPASSLASGASHLVCGRPITAAPDPRAAALAIAAEMAG